jgi:hypothetical protein
MYLEVPNYWVEVSLQFFKFSKKSLKIPIQVFLFEEPHSFIHMLNKFWCWLLFTLLLLLLLLLLVIVFWTLMLLCFVWSWHSKFHFNLSFGISLLEFLSYWNCCLRAGVSNSYWSEGHIQKKILRRPQFKGKKIPRATILIKSLQIKVNFVKNYCCVSFLDERGQQKCTWRATCGPRAACLRPLS